MVRNQSFVNRTLVSGLFEIICQNPILGFLSITLIFLISSIIPLAFIWLIQCFFLDFPIIPVSSPLVYSFFTLWSFVEVAFFFYQSYLYAVVQREAIVPNINVVERDRMYKTILSTIKDLRCTLTKWFLDHPIELIDKRSFMRWLSYAFYSKQYKELNDDEFEDLNSLLMKIQTDHQLVLTDDQSNRRISHMRHILDPVRVIFRPFVFYFVTDTLLNQVLARTLFYFKEYEHVRIQHLEFWIHRVKTSDKNQPEEEPIIFFHGIGAGLLMYQPFISRIHQEFSKTRTIIFISMRCICMRYPSIQDIPNMKETIDSIHEIFHDYQFRKAIFIGHSYGTACLSWIVKECPQYVARLIFIDPICFALFEPYIIYNFVYRIPHKLGQLYMYYFVCREMGISHVISRHFWWTQNNLFLEHVPNDTKQNLPTNVLLSGQDCIVNVHLVKEYLNKHKVNYFWARNLSHGDFMHHPFCWDHICEWISNKE